MPQKIVLAGPGKVRWTQEATARSAIPLLDVAACGICGTDRKSFAAPPAAMRLPVVPGHEFCGTLRVDGRRVVAWPAISCGRCSFCAAGRFNLCPDILLYGLHLDGGFQQLFSLPPQLARRAVFLDIPAVLSWSLAAVAEPLGCVIHSLAMINEPPAAMIILGAGFMGCLAARLAEHLWPRCLVEVVDPDPVRQQRFPERGRCDSADLVFLACSDPAAVHTGLQRLKPGGKILLFSGLNRQDNPLTVDYNRIHRREQTLYGSYGCLPGDMIQALELMALGEIIVDDLLTVVNGLERIPALLGEQKKSDIYKYVITSG